MQRLCKILKTNNNGMKQTMRTIFGYLVFIGSANTESENNDCKSLYVLNIKNNITRKVC